MPAPCIFACASANGYPFVLATHPAWAYQDLQNSTFLSQFADCRGDGRRPAPSGINNTVARYQEALQSNGPMVSVSFLVSACSVFHLEVAYASGSSVSIAAYPFLTDHPQFRPSMLQTVTLDPSDPVVSVAVGMAERTERKLGWLHFTTRGGNDVWINYCPASDDHQPAPDAVFRAPAEGQVLLAMGGTTCDRDSYVGVLQLVTGMTFFWGTREL